ncbi:MAG: imidazole glycerol phosphate synthase subunit HisH [Pseudomonadota bacterium]
MTAEPANSSPMTIAIIDLGVGNLRSVHKAVERAAHDRNLAAHAHVTQSCDAVRAADCVILPGVGAFGACMAGFNAIPGLREVFDEMVSDGEKPILGICVGMQILASRGLEFGDRPGLGYIPGTIRPIDVAASSVRVPHMGWNQIKTLKPHPVLTPTREEDTALDGADLYFLHSYHFDAENEDDVVASCAYGHGSPLSVMVGRGSLVGVQFHPEKSQLAGLHLLGNFLQWTVDRP